MKTCWFCRAAPRSWRGGKLAAAVAMTWSGLRPFSRWELLRRFAFVGKSIAPPDPGASPKLVLRGPGPGRVWGGPGSAGWLRMLSRVGRRLVGGRRSQIPPPQAGLAQARPAGGGSGSEEPAGALVARGPAAARPAGPAAGGSRLRPADDADLARDERPATRVRTRGPEAGPLVAPESAGVAAGEPRGPPPPSRPAARPRPGQDRAPKRRRILSSRHGGGLSSGARAGGACGGGTVAGDRALGAHPSPPGVPSDARGGTEGPPGGAAAPTPEGEGGPPGGPPIPLSGGQLPLPAGRPQKRPASERMEALRKRIRARELGPLAGGDNDS